MRRHPVRFLGFCVLLVVLAVAAVPVAAQTFTDRSDLLDVQIGRGISAWSGGTVDVNADGFLDLYQPGQIYLGGSTGYTGSLEALAAGYTSEYVFGATWADVDDDGFPEAFESVLRAGSSRFYANRSGFRLENRTLPSGLHFMGLAQGAAFADYNGDGTLDIFVGDDLGGSAVYFGNGQGGFVPSAQNAELGARPEKAYGVAAADFDGDGDIDVYIGACDQLTVEKSVNLFYRNRGDGTFDEVAVDLGMDDAGAAWGVVWLDIDNDGWLDLFVANMNVPGPSGRNGHNVLYRNRGDGTFEDVSEAAGIQGRADVQSFGAAAADMDNDGFVDIYVANALTGGASQLLRNNGDGTFTDIYETSGFLVAGTLPGTFVAQSHLAVAVGDLDGNGWVDVFTGSTSAPYNRVLLNDGGSNAWLGVRLNQEAPNRDAIGAMVRVHAGGRMQTRTITAGDGFVSQHFGLRTHVGLGTATQVDSVVVIWPDGMRQRLTALPVNQHLTIRKQHGPDAVPVAAEPVAGSWSQGHLVLEWAPGLDSDVDDVLEYQPVMLGPGGDVTTYGWTTDTRFELLADIVEGGVYTWAVVTRDGSTIRRSQTTAMLNADAVAVEGASNLPSTLVATAAWPNPAASRVTVRLESAGPDQVTVDLVDLMGRVVTRRGYRLSPGVTDLELDVSTLPAGHYVARITGESSGAPMARMVVVAR